MQSNTLYRRIKTGRLQELPSRIALRHPDISRNAHQGSCYTPTRQLADIKYQPYAYMHVSKDLPRGGKLQIFRLDQGQKKVQ